MFNAADADDEINTAVLGAVTAALAKKASTVSRKRPPPAATPIKFTRNNLELLPGFGAPAPVTPAGARSASGPPPGKRRLTTPPSTHRGGTQSSRVSAGVKPAGLAGRMAATPVARAGVGAGAGAGVAARAGAGAAVGASMPPRVQRTPVFSPGSAAATTVSFNSHLADTETADQRMERALQLRAGTAEDDGDDAVADGALAPPKRGVVVPLPKDFDCNVKGPFRYMYTPLRERAQALENRINTMQEVFVEASGIKEDLAPVGVPSQSPVTVFGRVLVDSEADGRLNASSVILEGSLASSGGARMRLNLSKVPAFALFPGQFVAVTGINSMGHTMMVSRVAQVLPAPRPHACLPDPVRDMATTATSATRVWTASGPFSNHDDLAFGELNDLLAAATSASPPPDVLVLVRFLHAAGRDD